ncbi:MAG: hypothetical protein J0H98_03195 [Solirubrobacterales bacterium]|nr:hypothetical protein [Solirubrobacterales bacterium]
MKKTNLVRPLAAVATLVAAIAMLMSFSVGSAMAQSLTSVTPTTIDVSSDLPVTIDVEGEDFGSYDPEEIAVGICTVSGYPPYGIPACGAFASDVAIDPLSGDLTASIDLDSTVIVDDHFGLPGHTTSPTFDCFAGSASNLCEVVVAHHPSGGSQTILDDQLLTFVP